MTPVLPTLLLVSSAVRRTSEGSFLLAVRFDLGARPTLRRASPCTLPGAATGPPLVRSYSDMCHENVRSSDGRGAAYCTTGGRTINLLIKLSRNRQKKKLNLTKRTRSPQRKGRITFSWPQVSFTSSPRTQDGLRGRSHPAVDSENDGTKESS
jgi:hypothetical protein